MNGGPVTVMDGRRNMDRTRYKNVRVPDPSESVVYSVPGEPPLVTVRVDQ